MKFVVVKSPCRNSAAQASAPVSSFLCHATASTDCVQLRVTPGVWVCVLMQVVDVDFAAGRATIKLVPRLDLTTMAKDHMSGTNAFITGLGPCNRTLTHISIMPAHVGDELDVTSKKCWPWCCLAAVSAALPPIILARLML